MSTEKKIPSKPTSAPKEQLAEKTKAMTTGDVVQKGGMSPLEGNYIDPQIGHRPITKK
jgi:hypothetical protein